MEMSPPLGDRTDTNADRSGATTSGLGTLGSVRAIRRFRPAQRRLEVPHSCPQGRLGIDARGLGRDDDLEQRAAENGRVAGVMDTRDAGAAGDLARAQEGVRVADGQSGAAGSSEDLLRPRESRQPGRDAVQHGCSPLLRLLDHLPAPAHVLGVGHDCVAEDVRVPVPQLGRNTGCDLRQPERLGRVLLRDAGVEDHLEQQVSQLLAQGRPVGRRHASVGTIQGSGGRAISPLLMSISPYRGLMSIFRPRTRSFVSLWICAPSGRPLRPWLASTRPMISMAPPRMGALASAPLAVRMSSTAVRASSGDTGTPFASAASMKYGAAISRESVRPTSRPRSSLAFWVYSWVIVRPSTTAAAPG